MNPVIVLLKNPLDPEDREFFTVEPGTRVIDWLQDVAPEGFDMPIRLFINQQEIAIEDSDYALKEDEVCAVLLIPAAIVWATVGQWLMKYVVPALIAAAAGIAIQLLFPPKRPGSHSYDSNPVYDIGATNNEARLGGAVPIIYGDPLTTPDYASTPYVFYSLTQDNNMFVDQLMCVGYGEFETITLSDIIVGDTPASDMPAGTIEFLQFQKAGAVAPVLDHKAYYAEIKKAAWADPFGGTDEFKFLEHCHTVPEITNWEFNSDTTTATKTFTAQDLTFVLGTTPYSNTMRFPAATPIRSGQRLTLTGAGGNTTVFLSGVKPDASAPLDSEGLPTFNIASIYSVVVPGNFPAATITLEVKTSNATAGPYVCCPVGKVVQAIYFDLESPQGLYRARSSGRYVYLGVDHQPKVVVTATEIDNNNNIVPGGVVASRPFTYNHNRPDPVRRSFNMAGQWVTSAGHTAADFVGKRYQVTMEAKHIMTDSQKIQNQVNWVGLRSEIAHFGESLYGQTTLLAVRMKASNGVSPQAQNRIKVRCRRKYPLLDGTVAWSSNPADVAHDIYTDKIHGAGRPIGEVDKTKFDDMKALWGMPALDPPKFNAVFLDRSTVWDGLESALSLALAKPAIDSGVLTIIAEKVKPNFQYVFNDSNIIPGSFEATFTLDVDGDGDGVQIEYRDPKSFDVEYVTHPAKNAEGNPPEYPIKIEYFGLTDKAYAQKLAVLSWNRRLYQRRMVKFSTEMDGMVPMPADRILVASPYPRWGISGRVVGIRDAATATPTLVLDKTLDWAAGGILGIVVKGNNGTSSSMVNITKGPLDNEVVLANALDVTIDMTLEQDPPAYTIQSLKGAGQSFVITKITHNGGVSFTIEAMQYYVTLLNTHPMYKGAPEHLNRDSKGVALI